MSGLAAIMAFVVSSFAMNYGKNEGIDGEMGGGRKHMAACHSACLDPVILPSKALVWGKGQGRNRGTGRRAS